MNSDFFRYNKNKDAIWLPRAVDYTSQRIVFDNLWDEIWGDKLINFIYTKAIEWKYEEEYRMLTSLVNCDEKFQPYSDKSIYIVPPNAINEIILGYNFQEKDLQDLRLFLHKNIQYSHVSLKRIELDSLEYKLNIVSQ